MSERGPIVCATDLGPTGALAVELAARMAAATGSPLRIVHVTGAGPELIAGEPMNEADRVLRERLRTRIEASAAALEKERVRAQSFGHHAEAELLEGRPWEEVIEYATRHEASLIVVGPHGHAGPMSGSRGELREWILGSTADRILRHADCPVLVGPRSAEHATPLRGARWLVAVDYSDSSDAALALAKRLAPAFEAKLIPFHVATLDLSAEGDEFRLNDPIRFAEALETQEGREHEKKLADHVREELGEELAVKVGIGTPARLVAQAANELDAKLIVMGTRGRTGIAHLLLGSTTERTLRRSDVPVLCVRA